MGTTEDLPSSPTVSDNSKDEDPCYEPEEPEDALSDEQTEGPKSGPSALGSILQRRKQKRSQTTTPAPESTDNAHPAQPANPPPQADTPAPSRGAMSAHAPLATRATVPGDSRPAVTTDVRATTPVPTSTDPPVATPSQTATQVEQIANASVKKRLRSTPGRTMSLLNVPSNPVMRVTRGAKAAKEKASKSPKENATQQKFDPTMDDAAVAAAFEADDDEDDFEPVEPASKKRNTRSTRPTRRATQRSHSTQDRNVSSTPEPDDVDARLLMKLKFPAELRDRIIELETELEEKEKRKSNELAAMRDRCKVMVLRYQKHAQQCQSEKQKLEEDLRLSQEAVARAEKAAKEAAAEASGRQDRVSPTRSLLSQAPETLACDVQEPSDAEASAKPKDRSFSKAALDAAVSAAVDGVERRYKQREREAQKKHEAVEHHLKARLLAAEVKHSPPAKTPTRDWGAQCDTAMAQQDAARQVTRRSPLRDALHVAAAVAPVAREGTDHTPSVRINFIISDSSTTGGLADNVAEARAPTNTEKQVSALTEDAVGSKADSTEPPSRPSVVEAATQVEMPPADTVSKTVARTETDPPQKRPAAPKTPQTAPAVHPTDGPAPMEGVQITEQPVDRKRAKIDEVRDLAHLAELLTTTHAGGDVQLGEMVVPVPMQSSADGVGWCDEAIWPEQGDITEAMDTSGLMSLKQHTNEQHIVCVVSKPETHITGGAFELHGNVALVFNSSCSKVVVSGSTFTGGVIVCHGKGCSITFSSAKFKSCTVVATAGADVAFEECQSSFDTNVSQGVSVFAHGTDTKVVMHGGNIVGGTQGMTIQAGARLEASKTSISHVSTSGVEVKDPNSHLVMSDSSLTQFRSRHNELKLGCGVHVHAEAHACLSCVSASRMINGVKICDRAYATISFCQVEDTKGNGILYAQHSRGVMKYCTVSRSQACCGVYVGSNCSLYAKHCNFLQNHDAGASACGQNAVLNLDVCASIGNKGCGFSADDNGTLKMTACTSEHDHIGAVACQGGKISLTKSHIMRSQEIGLYVYNAGWALTKTLSITRSGHQGVVVAKHRSKLQMYSSRVEGSQHGCVYVCGGASAKIKETFMAHSVTCAGVASDGPGTSVNLDNCEMPKNAKHGALAAGQSIMVIKNSVTKGNKLEGYMAHTMARMTCTDCKSEGDRTGIDGVPGAITMNNCTVDVSVAPTVAPSAAAGGQSLPCAADHQV